MLLDGVYRVRKHLRHAWVYCCGTAVLGYQPLTLSGSIQGSYPAGSSANLLTHTFNVDETKTITTLTVNSAQFQSNPTQVSGQCYIPAQGGNGGLIDALGAQQAGIAQGCYDPPMCLSGACSATVNLTSFAQVQTVAVFMNLPTWGFSNVQYAVFNYAYSLPLQQVGAMTFTVLKNGTAMALTITVAIVTDPTITLPNGASICFKAGDTITLQASNPSTSNDGLVSGTWSIQ